VLFQSKKHHNITRFIFINIIVEEPKAMGEHGMTVEMEEKMTNMIKNPSQKWSSNKILTDRMIKLVDEIKKLNSF